MIMEAFASEVRDAIGRVNEDFMTAYRQADAASLASLFTEDAQILAPNCGCISGRSAIQCYWQALFSKGVNDVQLETLEVEEHGDTAIEISEYTVRGVRWHVLDKGKYVVIWKRDDGQWKLRRDIFNSCMPRPATG